MRLRLRGPEGVSTLNLPDTTTVGDLRAEIASNAKLPAFDLKVGYPPKALDLDAFDDSLPLADTGVKWDGEQVTVSSRDVLASLKTPLNSPPTIPAPVSRAHGASRSGALSKAPTRGSPKPQDASSDPPEIAMPAMQGTLVLRVMPDDNSCLFRALSYAVLGDIDGMHELRSIVASAIQAQPDVYTAAVLERSPDDYCRWITGADSWGGAIEMGILSQHFDVEIASVNVEDLRIDRFNEGRAARCILVYSGIHYDCIVLNPSTHPYARANGDPAGDQKIFDAVDEAPVQGALRLCNVLKERHYFTNSSSFTIRCGVCGWRGKGEKEAIKHAGESGHNDFNEA